MFTGIALLLLSVGAIGVIALVPPPHARIVGRDAGLDVSYDFVIVGGGTSGLTVADRLTENPDTSVLVIEYGPLDKHEPSVLVPGLLNLSASPYLFNLKSVPQRGLAGGTFAVPAAAVVGGGTAVNGMFFDRASAADYDAWTELGGLGWGWADLLPYFKKSENFTPAAQSFAEAFDISWDDSVHGYGGPVQSSYPVFQFPSIKNFFRAWDSLGVPTPKDPGGGGAGGAFWAPSSLDPTDETRSYARTAHYDRVIASRPNYHLLTNTVVRRIIFNGSRAVGAEFVPRETNQSSRVLARNEVILAAGSVHSPQILQLSGVGPAGLLKSLGIQAVADLPGVGQNFQDHPTLYSAFSFETQPTPNLEMLAANLTYAAEQLALYWSDRQGPYTIVNQGGNTVAFLPLPNITSNYQSIINLAKSQPPTTIYPSSIEPSVLAGYVLQRSIILRLYASTTASVQETGWNGGSVIPITLVKPLSRGSININSTDILQPPLIDFGALEDPTDLEILIAALRVNRAMVASPPMQELTPLELAPGVNLTSDEQLRAALRQQIVPTYSHPCCTCALMRREFGGVVDADLQVYGVEGLSIVDASIMPLIPATHTSATVYAVAEKAADIIKARHSLP
ncbi:MAG: hypothetical protein M1840_005562 [Geoglossum simile]|nr:MAG: hypothetical protein M1840_005562 [Geoglossum simile]